MTTPLGDLYSHISVLVAEINEMKKGKESKKYNYFLQTIKGIATTITSIQPNINRAPLKKREKFIQTIDTLISSLKTTINTLLEKIRIFIEKSKESRGEEVTDEKKFLNVLESQLRETGEITSELLSKINTTENSALDRYLFSILSTKTRTPKYPWTYYVPTIEDLKRDRLEDVYINGDEKNPQEIKRKYVHNFMIMFKQVYYMTKTNVRNISMIRLADLNDVSEKFIKYKKILETLLFTSINDEFIPGDYNSLLSSYSSHTTSLSKLLGGDNYKRLIYHVINDGSSFNNTKMIKTETLVKYILIAIQKVSFSNIDQHTKLYDAIVSFTEKVLEDNSNIADLSSIVELSDKEFNRSDLAARHNRGNNVFTFVKIRADRVGSLVETNQRYRVGLDRDRQIMYMGYDSYPDSIYDISLSLKKEFEYLANNKTPLPNNYLFGPFSYIFKPSDDNSIISKHESMKPLLDNIKNGKSVCVIGYGASGSGKTTALVYAGFEKNQDQKNGILIHFCNTLHDYYGEIDVSFLELEGNINEDGDDAVSNFKILPIPRGDEKALNGDKSFKYTKDDELRQEYYSSRTFTTDPNSNEWVLEEDSNLLELDGVHFTKGLDIGKYIVSIMDGKRSIQATTNNPVSSRSHMIIFVKFKNKKSTVAPEKEPYLIICDFAGVENKFQCNDDKVLSMFEKIKSQTKCKDKNVSKSQCRDFENFYDVQTQVDEQLHSNEATYEPSPETILNIHSAVSNAALSNIFTSNEQAKNKFRPISKILDSIIMESYTKNKNKLLEDALFNVRDVITSPKYPTHKQFMDSFYNSDSDVDIYLKKLLQGLNISNVTGEVDKTNKNKNLTRRMPKFRLDMYNSGLITDNYIGEYQIVQTEKKLSRGLIPTELDIVNERTSHTLSSPLIDHMIEYIDLVLPTIVENDKNNKEIVIKTQLKKDVISRASSFRSQTLAQICNKRVKEGLFINSSLLSLRSFISHFVTGIQNNDGKIVNPKFIDECAPLQCNPNFEDCFGNTTILDKNINESSVIANEIRNRLCCVDNLGKSKIGCKPKVTCEDFKDITFAIFNVINLTKKTNNPPPIPHIDLTDLMMELSRLESVKTMLVMNEYKINDDMTASYVHPIYLDLIRNSNLLDEKFPGSLKGEDKNIILDTISILDKYGESPPHDVNTTINALKLLISIINTTNSLSLIGTMEFTDMISKFGLNRTTCNYKYYEEDKTPKLGGKQLEEFKISVSEYKSFILNLHDKYNEGIIETQ